MTWSTTLAQPQNSKAIITSNPTTNQIPTLRTINNMLFKMRISLCYQNHNLHNIHSFLNLQPSSMMQYKIIEMSPGQLSHWILIIASPWYRLLSYHQIRAQFAKVFKDQEINSIILSWLNFVLTMKDNAIMPSETRSWAKSGRLWRRLLRSM